ncbi:24375_t:CDS:2 [Gigaspora rosea]|nr:24375_t:CDS:2 [Gigaspora rosea]
MRNCSNNTTGCLYLILSLTLGRVARLFKALYLGVNRLKEYYESLDALSDLQNSHEIGKALKLLHINKEEVNSFYIVVMDYVKAKPLYSCSSLLSHDECKMVYKNIEEAISKLHKENIVFADLRNSNILVTKSQDQYQEMLIDFN